MIDRKFCVFIYIQTYVNRFSCVFSTRHKKGNAKIKAQIYLYLGKLKPEFSDTMCA